MNARGPWILLGLALGAIAFVYHPLRDAGFVYWDDHALFTDNVDVRDFRITRFFTDLAPGGYFPLVRVSLALDHLLFGYSAPASHAINVALHALVTVLVAGVARANFGLARGPAAIVAVLFAVHPLAVEPVSWVSGGRKDLLCTTFYLLTLRALARGRPRGAFLAAGLALLSKAIAVTLVPWSWLTRRRNFALALLPFALAVGVVELVAQRTGLRVASEGDSVPHALARAATSLAFALARAVCPHRAAVYYDRDRVAWDGWDTLAMVLVVGLAGFAAWRKDRRALAGLGFFLLALAPTLKLVPFGQDGVFNDRYAYLPSVGLLAFFVRTIDLPRAWRALWIAPVVAFALQAHAQTRAWTSQETLWLDVEAKYPGSRKVAPNLALYYLQNGENEKAFPWASRAVSEEPRDVEARSNLAVNLTRLGRLGDARRVLEQALELAPASPMLFNNLGWVHLKAGDKVAAHRAFAEALRLAPEFAPAREGLARANAR